MEALVIQIVSSGLRILGQIAPTIAAAFTGGQSVEEAIAGAQKIADALPEATDAWHSDAEARAEGGESEPDESE